MELFTALSEPTRRAILRALRGRDMTAGELADRFPLARSTLSGHFNALKAAGFVVAERNGTSIVYSLNVSALEEAVGMVMELLGTGRARERAERAMTTRTSWRYELPQLLILGGLFVWAGLLWVNSSELQLIPIRWDA